MQSQSTPIAVDPVARQRHAVASFEDEMAAFRAEARGVHLVGVRLTFGDVFHLVWFVFLAQLLLTGILVAFALAVWLIVR